MVANFPGRTVAEYMAMGREIEVGTEAVHLLLPGQVALAMDGESFVGLVTGTHKTIFERAFGNDAGRLRAPGEDVVVGHDQHRFQGAPGDEIEGSLRALGDRLAPARAPEDIHRFAQWAAMFIRELFVIHPFVDGNGRTARAIVEATARSVGHVVEWPVPTSRRKRTADKAEYLRALEHAHACLGLTRAGELIARARPADAFAPLARWWRRRLSSAAEHAERENRAMEEFMGEPSELDDAAIGQLVADLEELERARAHDEAFGQWLEDETLRRFRLPVVVHGTALA
ncbi:MAG: Fic family protein [Sandaracinaceae bacterium]|nr:Fic family protein [Myxococcales bacterium]MCB9658461.1 Fic family protein [Sandaracinaceae bacterium]